MNETIKRYKHIVAGNYNEYQNYVKHKPRDEYYYKYVTTVDDIRGLNYIEGYYIGTYNWRSDIIEIKEMILTIKYKMASAANVTRGSMSTNWADVLTSSTTVPAGGYKGLAHADMTAAIKWEYYTGKIMTKNNNDILENGQIK